MSYLTFITTAYMSLAGARYRAEKNSKLAELKELTDILEGTNLFEELNDLNAMTNRHEKTSAPTGRKTKVDEIEYMIMDAEKALNHSRDRLASSMLLASDMKSGVLHLLRLLKMDKVRNTLLAESSFDSSNNGDISNSYGRRGDRASAIFSALNSIEERLGQMVDVLDIVKQSRSQSLARRSSSNKVSPSSKKKRKRKAKSNKNYWDPSRRSAFETHGKQRSASWYTRSWTRWYCCPSAASQPNSCNAKRRFR